MKRYRLRSTILTLVLLAFAFGYSVWVAPASVHRRTLEVGTDGRLRDVDRPTVVATPLIPPDKPEPGWIVGHAARLSLSTEALHRVRAIHAAWIHEKETMEAEMCASIPRPDSRARTSTGSLLAELEEYSEISRRYGTTRAQRWNEALACLEPEQRVLLARLMRRSGGSKP